MSRKTRLMLGPSLENKGGITTVINLYQEAGYLEKHFDYLVTAQDGSTLRKLWLFGSFPVRLLKHLLTNPDLDTVVMQVSQRGSFIRKSLAMLICQGFGKQVVFHKHGSEFVAIYHDKTGAIGQFLMRWVLRRVNCIVALSESRRQELLRIEPRANVKIVYNPCLLGIQQKHLLPFRYRRLNKQTPVQFLFMGRLGQRKGVYDLLEALKILKQDHSETPNLQVLMFGDGEYKTVQAKIAELGLNDMVCLRQWIAGEEKHQVFMNADVLLLPSYNEGLPMSILEAMGYGMPVISTVVGGIPEAVLNKETGILIQPGDCNGLAAAMLSFVNSPEQIERMGQKAWTLASQQFEVSKVVRDYEIVFQ
jgi:glycosyltransferase involved in cell wall biosynthesis